MVYCRECISIIYETDDHGGRRVRTESHSSLDRFLGCINARESASGWPPAVV